MELVAFIGKDKENWGQISALVNRMDSKKILLIKDKSAEGFPSNDKCKVFSVDTSKSLFEMKTEIQDNLRKELTNEFEVALSIASGTGKDHMALVSALLSIPVGIKLVAYTKEGVKFIT